MPIFRRVPFSVLVAAVASVVLGASLVTRRVLSATAIQRQASVGGTLASILSDRTVYFIGKRALDIVVSSVLLVLLAPVMLLIAVLVRLDSPGSSIYAQERIGTRVKYKGGQKYWELRPFIVYKFRTMRENVDSSIHQAFVKALINGDEAGMSTLQNGNAKAKYKLNNDPRITRLGQFLRRSSLDELPQLWNVLKGDMSLVGPRPPLAYEVEMYSPAHMRRLEAQPGLTGLWQVSARSEVDFDQMVALDVQYIDSQSFGTDLSILLKTPVAVLTSKGAS